MRLKWDREVAYESAWVSGVEGNGGRKGKVEGGRPLPAIISV